MRSVLLNRVPFFLFIQTICFCSATSSEEIEVIRVEETWELSVGEPNLEANGPQVSMLMSPSSTIEDDYFMFLLNFKTAPNYVPGGAQIQHCNSDVIEDFVDSNFESTFSVDYEVVQWTQSMTVNDGNVVFDIENGSSETWGGFGGEGKLKYTVHTGQENLNSYSPILSLKQSGIGFAGNRVASLKLLRIRWVLSNGQTYQLEAPIDIDSDIDPWTEEE